MSERLHAVVVPNFEVLRERKIVNTREAIRFDIETLSAQLPSTKRILGFDIWQEDLPRTTTRKMKRFEIERRVLETQSALPARPTERPIPARGRKPMARRARRRSCLGRGPYASNRRRLPVHPRDNLELDLGLDSMERVELLVALERELGASVPDTVVSEVYSVRELVDAVRQSIGHTGRAHQPAAWDSILASDPTDPEVLAVVRRNPLSDAGGSSSDGW